MNVKVVLVEPLYQQNLGYSARVLKNFGIKEMNLVKPRCNYKGKDAVKYSKHAVDLIKSARVYKSIKEATKDCDIVIGTTGQWFRTDAAFYNIFPAEKLSSLAKGKKAALLIGRDDLGLTKSEMRDCDATIFIPASKEYPVLNISHALAILLYELNRNNKALPEYLYATKTLKDSIVKLFEMSLKNRKDIRDKKSVVMAFRHVINRGDPTSKELNALAVSISPTKNKGNRT